MDNALRTLVRKLTDEWQSRPFCILACQDGSNEHWQIYHPRYLIDEAMPRYTIDAEGVVFEHE